MELPSPDWMKTDKNNIPHSVGNRHHRRMLAAKTPNAAEINDQFNKEPVWKQMQSVMETMKAWYALNGTWVFTDPAAMAVLEDMRKDHEKREAEIERLVNEALEEEHKHLDKIFERVRDKKILKNQLVSMRKEYHMLLELAKLRTAGKGNTPHGKK